MIKALLGMLAAAATAPANLLTNGDFQAGNFKWATSSPGTTFSAGKAHLDGAEQKLSYDDVLALGNGLSFTVTYTVSEYVSGSITPQFTFNDGGPAVNGVARNANGTYSETMVSNGNNRFRFIGSVAVANISIDDVSLTPQ